MRQGSAEPIQLPDHQAIASADESKRLGQAGTVAAAAAGPILEQVTLIDAGGEQRVALQVQHLSVAARSRRACSRPACAENLIQKGFRTVLHSDRVCRAVSGPQTASFRAAQ